MNSSEDLVFISPEARMAVEAWGQRYCIYDVKAGEPETIMGRAVGVSYALRKDDLGAPGGAKMTKEEIASDPVLTSIQKFLGDCLRGSEVRMKGIAERFHPGYIPGEAAGMFWCPLFGGSCRGDECMFWQHASPALVRGNVGDREALGVPESWVWKSGSVMGGFNSEFIEPREEAAEFGRCLIAHAAERIAP